MGVLDKGQETGDLPHLLHFLLQCLTDELWGAQWCSQEDDPGLPDPEQTPLQGILWHGDQVSGAPDAGLGAGRGRHCGRGGEDEPPGDVCSALPYWPSCAILAARSPFFSCRVFSPALSCPVPPGPWGQPEGLRSLVPQLPVLPQAPPPQSLPDSPGLGVGVTLSGAHDCQEDDPREDGLKDPEGDVLWVVGHLIPQGAQHSDLGGGTCGWGYGWSGPPPVWGGWQGQGLCPGSWEKEVV